MYSTIHRRKQNEVYNRIDEIVKSYDDISQSDYQALMEAVIIDALNWKE